MAHFQRLIRGLVGLVFGLLIGGFSVGAFAVDNIIVGISDYSYCGGSLQGLVGAGWPPAPSTADFNSLGPGSSGVPSGAPVLEGQGSGTYSGVSTIYQDWKQNYSNPTGQRVCRVWRGAAPSCPEGETWDPGTGQCESICQPGYTWNGSTCENPCQAKAGNSYGTGNSWAMLDVDTVPSGAPTFCDGSCSVTGGKVECERVSAGGTTGEYVSLGSTCTVQGPFTYTGEGCGPGGSAPQLVGVEDVEKPWWDKGLDAKDCSAQGGYWGNVNGIDACVRPQPGETFEKDTATGNETGTETATAADGTTTEKQTTTSTECKDGKCTTTTTTTTTTKGADGQQIGDATTETKREVKQEADFCKLNPQHAHCAGTETGGSFAGSCASGFTCSGDAVQCAIAKAQHESTCALAVGDGVLGEFSAIQGFDGTAPGEGLDRKQIDVPTSLDVAEIGGGAGLTDMTITVMGQSIEIPLSELNRFIAMFGYAIMAIAWVGAWRIISGAF